MSKRSAFRVGVVGVRGRGLSLARYWRLVPGARLVAVADLVPERLAAVRQELGDLALYPSHHDLLAREQLDIVTVGTAANAHARVTIDAANRGVRAVYCEKPMAQSLAECDAMIAACRSAGTLLVIGHQRRWAPAVRAIRHAIQSGAIGRPTNAYLTWASGRVGTEGTHKWDAISYMLDDEVAWVRCLLDRRRTSEHPIFGPEMTTDPGPLGIIAFRRGTRLTIDGWNDVMMPYTYIFFGTRGRIELREWALGSAMGHAIEYWARDEDHRDPQFGRRPLPRREFPFGDPTEAPVAPEVRHHPDYPTIRALADVVHCLETGAQPPSTGEHGRHALEVIAALHLSAEADMRQVDLPLVGDVLQRQFAVR
jgi:predicted dehydrogenase